MEKGRRDGETEVGGGKQEERLVDREATVYCRKKKTNSAFVELITMAWKRTKRKLSIVFRFSASLWLCVCTFALIAILVISLVRENCGRRELIDCFENDWKN